MKNNILLVLVFLSGAVFGGFIGGEYVKKHTPAPVPCVRHADGADLLLARLEQDGSPDGEQTIQPQSAAQLPSQLVRAELPADILLGVKPENASSPAKTSGIVLDDTQTAVVLQAQKPAHRASDEQSSITLIEAPVKVKRIQSLDDYKQFKHTARGSYPTADFSKEEVFVLESESNLPDKAFEIVEIVPTESDIKVLYRVNLLGLDQKTNTHSAQKVAKMKLPVVLEQVL